MNDELLADLIGARLVYGDEDSDTDGETAGIYCPYCSGIWGRKKAWRQFSISNKADRMDVVEALGEKHGISVGFFSPHGNGWIEWSRGLLSKIQTGFDSHEEATRAALLTLKDEYAPDGK